MKKTVFGKPNNFVRSFDPSITALTVVRSVTLFLSAGCLAAQIWLEPWRFWLFLASALLGGWEILWGALQEILLVRFHRGQLITVASCSLMFAIGRCFEACVALLIAVVGFWLREVGRHRAATDVEFYQQLSELRARIKEEMRFAFRDAATLAHGMVVEVFSGETVPVDGVVVSGGGMLDYSGWMQQGGRVAASEGTRVYCGAVNYGQPISVRVTAAGKHTLAQKIYEKAERALQNKSTVQRVLSKLTWVYGALMLLLALIFGVFVPLLGGLSWGDGAYRAACIIALAGMGEIVVSVSLAFEGGIAHLSRKGVLFKSCRQVMLLRHITDVVFSKTGTLTRRNFNVDEVVPHNEFTKEELLYYAAAAEQISKHLIAAAIMKKAGNIKLPLIDHELEIPGEGVCVVADGKRIFVGNERLMRRAGVETLPYRGGGMVCFVAVEETYIGCIILNDPIKSSAVAAVDGLFALGMRSIDLVTGDNEQNGEAVSLALGLHCTYAGKDRQEKSDIIRHNRNKQKYGGRVAFVGDESDSECLKAADLSFSLQTVEDDVQEWEADITVLSDDPMGVLQSFVLTKRIRNVVNSTILLSALFKIAMLVSALLGIVPFWSTVLCEAVLSLLGTLLASRTKKA